MTNCMHFMHPPKIIQIWWGRHDNFCVWKKSAITFGEGCILMLDIHVYSAFMAWNLGYLAKKVRDIPPTLTKINLFGLTWFLCMRYIHTNVCWSFFHFGNTIFLLGKNYQTWNLTHRSPCYELPIISICNCDWLIDEIWFFFLSAEYRHALNYGHTDLSIALMIGLQLCTAWIVSSCFNIHAYIILFYKENAT